MPCSDGNGGTGTSTDAAVRATDVVREHARGSGGFLRGDPLTIRALDGLSLAVECGEIVGVAGPNGSSKSTLLHLLAGLDVPTEGRITLAGEDTGALTVRKRGSFASITSASSSSAFTSFPPSARANVALPLVERGVGKRKRRDRATDRQDATDDDVGEDHEPEQDEPAKPAPPGRRDRDRGSQLDDHEKADKRDTHCRVTGSTPP